MYETQDRLLHHKLKYVVRMLNVCFCESLKMVSECLDDVVMLIQKPTSQF